MQIHTRYPLTRYLARGEHPNWLLARFLLMAGVVALPATWIVTRQPGESWRLPLAPNNLVLEFAALVILLAPAVSAASAVLLTVQRLRDPAYQFLRLTPVAPGYLVRGHVRAILLSLRNPLAMVAGLSIALDAGVRRLTGQWTMCYPLRSPFDMTYRQPWASTRFVVWRIDRLGLHPEFHGWLIGLWGAILLGVTLGVWLALRWQKRSAAVAAPILLLIGAIGPLVAIPWLPLEHLPLVGRVLLVAAYVLVPFGLAWLAGRGAGRAVR